VLAWAATAVIAVVLARTTTVRPARAAEQVERFWLTNGGTFLCLDGSITSGARMNVTSESSRCQAWRFIS
jgi:hypothetical protein